jgi:PAB-dependent poly(A)-specific ribonuclease subunit 2
MEGSCPLSLTIAVLSDHFLELPGKGDLVAIDAEFVCVQAEQSIITPSGSKEIVSEARNALARLSIIDCRTNDVIVDDYVVPREKIVDCLTRFSGIRESDLDQSTSPHHLVTPQDAYLKVRLLMERGCLFVGHGLSQDFRVINICIPPHQIIDTAVIYHQPNQRFISLRYLTNYVLGRDMQQEVHDSVEDARAAHELYKKALTLKSGNKFGEYLVDLYTHGHRTQFKLGVFDEKHT